MPIWIVTGGSGFLGRALLDEIRRQARAEIHVIAIGRRQPPDWPGHLFRIVDLESPDQFSRLIDESPPSILFHIAGQTPPASPDEFYQRNTLTTLRILESLRESNRICRVVLAGSAAEMGPVPVEELPVSEEYVCRPTDSYSRSKWLASMAGLARWGLLEVVVARIFNPIGPGLPRSQAFGRFAEVLATGRGPLTLSVGDLTTRRDFVDVRDVARALYLLSDRGNAGQLYHVGTGQSRSVAEGLDQLIAWSGRDVKFQPDPLRTPASGPADSRADVRKINAHVGWAAQIDWEQSLRDLWEAAQRAAPTGLTDPRPSV